MRAMFSEADRDNLRWFWHHYLKDKSKWLLLVFGFVTIQAFVYQQFLSITESGLRVIFEDGQVGQLVRVCAIVFLLFTTRAVLSYVVPRLSIWLAGNAVRKMRYDIINHLLLLDLAYFDRVKSGDIILRLVNQIDGLSGFVGQKTVGAVRDFVTVVVVSGYLIYKSPLLFSAAIIFIPVIIFGMRKISHTIKEVQLNAENVFGAYISGIEALANSMRTIKISGQEPRERERLLNATDGIRDLMIRLTSVQALMAPAIDLVSALVYVLVIGGGGYMVINGIGGMDAAGIIAFLLGLVLLFDPLRNLANFFTQLQASLILLGSVRSVHNEKYSITDHPDSVETFDNRADIVFSDVDFGYIDARPLFEDLNITIEGGKKTAIVGATGSGKTTILSLITRLYDVTGGNIRIGGIDVRDIKLKALRASFSVVAQDIVIFNDSVWENIRYFSPKSSDEEVWAAAELAEIADLIRSKGDMPVGPNGTQLSGGQRQRIAIARAFLRAAPILLLDEATSALDQKTEQRIQTALRKLSENKTTIIVAHRLSSVVDADMIYVMDMGKVIEQGSHKELLAQNGVYAAMFNSQAEGYS